MALNYYNTGTASVANGSAAVVGVGTSWLATVKADDLYVQNGLALRVLSVTDNTHLTLVSNWPGTTTSGLIYEVRFPPPSASITASLRTLLDSLTSGILTTLAGNVGANSITLLGSTTTNPVSILPAGTDTNIGLDLKTKGTGSLRLVVNATNVGIFSTTAFDIAYPQSAASNASLTNTSTNNAAAAMWRAVNSAHSIKLGIFSTAFTPAGLALADAGVVLTDGAGGLVLGTLTTAPITFGYNNAAVGTLDNTKLNLTVPVVTTNLANTNIVINGDMRIDQRNNGTSVTYTNISAYICDRFQATSSGLTTQTVAAQRVASTLTGSAFSLKTTVGGTGAAPASSAYNIFAYKVEGYDCAQLLWGTANAKPITLSFRAKSTVAGTYAVTIRNAAANRCYVASYTLSANVDTFVQLTFPGDTTGTWATDNGSGMIFFWDLGVGSTISTTAGTWQAGAFIGFTGGTKLIATTGATFEMALVKMEVSSVATPFIPDNYWDVWRKCRRYYRILGLAAVTNQSFGLVAIETSTQGQLMLVGEGAMRSLPSISTIGSFFIFSGGSGYGATVGISSYATYENVQLQLAGSSFPVGSAGILCDNSTTGRIILDSEL